MSTQHVNGNVIRQSRVPDALSVAREKLKLAKEQIRSLEKTIKRLETAATQN